MSEQSPLEPIEPTDEQRRLAALFADMDSKQLDFLDEAGKSIIERIATFLAVLFAVTAFGGNFPPAYLKGNHWEKYLVIAILICYLLAMGMGMLAIRPRRYASYRYNVTRMKHEFERLITYKKRLMQWAGLLFAGGSVALAALIISIIWNV
jgi:hypothetical protein